MNIRKLLVLVFAVGVIPSLALAGAPPNDKEAKAKALAGVSGTIASTNVEASVEQYENTHYQDNVGKTVWYSYKAPADGFLEIIYDFTNDSGGLVTLAAFAAEGGYQGEVPANGMVDIANGKITKAIPCTRGGKVKLQFDTSASSGTATAGAFGFSYAFKTGAGFRLEGAQKADMVFRFRENETPISLTVSRIGSTEGAASVNYELANESADSATDLSTPSDSFTGTLSFAPGESRRTLSFSINDDALTEGSETFTFKLSAPSAGNVVLDPATPIVIEDNDGAPSNDNLADAIVIAGSTASLTVPSGLATEEAGEPVGGLQSVWYRWTAPADGVLTVGANSVNFGDLNISLYSGTSIGSLVPLLDANPDNGGQIFQEGAAAPSFAVASGVTYSIAIHGYSSADVGATTFTLDFKNQSSPTLAASIFSFTKDRYDVLESGTNAVITIRRAGATDKPSSVHFSTSLTTSDPEDANSSDWTPFAEPDVDYTTQNATEIAFAVGETTKQVQVAISNNTKKEGTEHFFVRLAGASEDSEIAGPAHATVLIHEGKALPVSYFYYDNFNGVLHPQSGPGGEGTILVKLTSSGAFTGTIILDGAKLGFKDAFPPLPGTNPGDSSTKMVHIARTGLPDVVLTFLYEIDAQYNTHLHGTVTDGSSISTFATPNPAYFDKRNPTPILGTFTIILTPDAAVPAAIRAPGFLSLVVKPKGVFTLLGGLPDGTKIAASGTLTYSGYENVTINGSSFSSTSYQNVYDAAFTAPLYKGTGHISGTMHLGYGSDPTPAPAIGDGTASIRWVHPAMAAGPVLTAFAAPLESFVSRFTVPKGGLVLPVTAPQNFNLAFTAGGLPSITPLGTFTAKGPVAFPIGATNAPSLIVNAKTGLFLGKFTPSGGGKPVPFQGAVSRNRLDGTGNFLNGSAAGSVKLDLVP